MDRIPFLIARYPRESLIAGKAVFLAGSIAVLAAVSARAALANLNEERVLAKLPPLRTLAEAFPAYPTALVPEGVVGFCVAAALVVAGMTLIAFAEKAEKR